MNKKITITTLKKYKAEKQKFSVLTAYDCYTAKYIDEAGVDVVLIGDSLAMVALGYDYTNAIGVDEMKIFTRAVVNGVKHALVITDMPFLSYHTCVEDAVKNCGLMIRVGANGVKIEGGSDYIISVIERLVQVGIPVMGHLGFTPQFLNQLGGYKIQGKTKDATDKILSQARRLEDAGAFSVVLEMMPEESSKYITENLKIPTISCGAGRYCDGQVLVCDDVFGKYPEFTPKFARKYGNMYEFMYNCAIKYNDDVKSGKFPEEKEVFNGTFVI